MRFPIRPCVTLLLLLSTARHKRVPSNRLVRNHRRARRARRCGASSRVGRRSICVPRRMAASTSSGKVHPTVSRTTGPCSRAGLASASSSSSRRASIDRLMSPGRPSSTSASVNSGGKGALRIELRLPSPSDGVGASHGAPAADPSGATSGSVPDGQKVWLTSTSGIGFVGEFAEAQNLVGRTFWTRMTQRCVASDAGSDTGSGSLEAGTNEALPDH